MEGLQWPQASAAQDAAPCGRTTACRKPPLSSMSWLHCLNPGSSADTCHWWSTDKRHSRQQATAAHGRGHLAQLVEVDVGPCRAPIRAGPHVNEVCSKSHLQASNI